eukprot:m.103786 g.103786  ORF g.103786 m.103786 type:complete len:91 (+) comp15597_c0_seq4:226-498(+)
MYSARLFSFFALSLFFCGASRLDFGLLLLPLLPQLLLLLLQLRASVTSLPFECPPSPPPPTSCPSSDPYSPCQIPWEFLVRLVGRHRPFA